MHDQSSGTICQTAEPLVLIRADWSWMKTASGQVAWIVPEATRALA